MSLKTFFGGKDDAITIYRRDLIAAVKNGNQDRLQDLLLRNIDAPPAALNDALNKAISLDRLKMTEILIAAPGTRTIDNSTLRQVVYDDASSMFRLLSDKGWNFAAAVPNGDGAQSYMSSFNAMQKDLTITRLREEVAALKLEVAELKKGKEAAPVAGEPAKKDASRLDL